MRKRSPSPVKEVQTPVEKTPDPVELKAEKEKSSSPVEEKSPSLVENVQIPVEKTPGPAGDQKSTEAPTEVESTTNAQDTKPR